MRWSRSKKAHGFGGASKRTRYGQGREVHPGGVRAVNRLKGLDVRNFGGRPMGMYKTVANLDEWQERFGIDVENVGAV